MTALTLTMTTAGLGRFTAAQASEDIDLTIATVGLTAAAFVVAPTLTALPGEFRRVGTIAGSAVGDNIVHMIVRDDAARGYDVRGFGLFLADGTLFAVYGQADPIVGKSPLATLLFALDIAFPTSDIAQLTFGDTNFLNPPATRATKGVVELADDAEIDAGTDDSRAVTPKGLARRLGGGIAGYVAATRKVLTTGLATGGRALDDDVTVNVPAASAAEADAGTLTTKALTPASLANVLLSILDRVRLSRRVDTAGLAIGGGALTTDITISVAAATAAMLRAGGATNAAATPKALADAGAVYVVQQAQQVNGGYRVWSDGLKECWGSIGVPAGTTVTVALPIAHTSFVAPAGAAGAIAQDEQMLGILNVGLNGFDVRNRNPMAATYYWHTKGV
jgi:hypothetical protein